ncbi:Rrf2 family transcriptional regulator [Dictyobacter sp. S3.2.2.5]|uniref:Rrf2 family transcriptional regulator n=1 Tax=Dictyobacter halimunensis TaxID=3026934 RepID=A0ABQ6FS18_9CHLR|nr:Rrf2 family transcriptional regulator [Dictyobacter sp. S3.2.2.5]
MSANSRLSLAVHTLVWMAEFGEEHDYAPSERIARSVKANPVVLRGLLGLMEKQHLVCVQRGSNAGWKLARRPEEITLLEVYRAVESGTLFSLHHTPPDQRCRVGCGIIPTLENVYEQIQDTMEQEMARTTIADILRDTLAHTAEVLRRGAAEASTETQPGGAQP